MENIIIWGTGEIASWVFKTCTTLNEYNIVAILDNNMDKVGTLFMGMPVIEPRCAKELKGKFSKIVILANAFEEIRNDILKFDLCNKDQIENKYYFYKRSIQKRYSTSHDAEILQITKYLERHSLDVFNYSFAYKYKSIDVEVVYDDNNDMFFVIHNGKRMYFSREYDNIDKVKKYYASICMEQDQESPHKYLDEKFNVKEGDVVVDVGAAEGNFSLEIIDRVSRLYIIETDENWIAALEETFAPYEDKVTIVQAYCSSYDEGKFCRLDGLIKEKVNFIKMDIEGNEWDALQGAEKIIEKSSAIRLAVCCYHADYDQTLIENVMDNMGIMHCTSRGYMWFPYLVRQNYVSTRLNRALVRGWKK